MKHCTYCGFDNTDEATVCKSCGTDLFEAEVGLEPGLSDKPAAIRTKLVFEPLDPKDIENDLVTLVKCSTLIEADVLVSHLEAAEIPAFIPDEFATQNMSFTMNASQLIRVQVSPKDYEAAKEYLASFDNDSPNETPTTLP